MNVARTWIDIELVAGGIFNDQIRWLSCLSLAACILYFSAVYGMLHLLYLCVMGRRGTSPYLHQ
jgi:hypothetical protein